MEVGPSHLDGLKRQELFASVNTAFPDFRQFATAGGVGDFSKPCAR